MANSRRNLSKFLTCATLAIVCLCGPTLKAEETDVQTFRTLAVRRAAPKVFYTLDSKEIPIFAGETALSGKYEVPSSGKLEVYTYVPAKDPKLPREKLILAEATFSDSKENLLLVASASGDDDSGKGIPIIKLRAVDASIAAHPLNTVRVFNFSEREIAAKIAEEFGVIPSGSDSNFIVPEGNKMWVKIAAFEGSDEGWIMRNGGPKAVFPNTRSIIILSDAYPSEEDPEGKRINLRNVIDRTPPVEFGS